MDPKIIEGLRAAVMAAYPAPQNAATREPLLAALRAEDFWNGRAPQMAEELLILRRFESHACAIVAQDPEHERADVLANISSDLDALRAKHAEGR